MATVKNPMTSKYYEPALALGKALGFSPIRAKAFALRTVTAAANGSYYRGQKYWERLAFTLTTVDLNTVRRILSTRPSTWARWEERARKAGLHE